MYGFIFGFIWAFDERLFVELLKLGVLNKKYVKIEVSENDDLMRRDTKLNQFIVIL